MESKTLTICAATVSVLILLADPAMAQSCGTVGSGGSAAAGDTSASTLGTGGACQGEDGTTGSIGSGGSAATGEGKAMSRTKVNETGNGALKAQSKAQAMDQGTFSKSKTKTSVEDGQLQSRTKTMSHVPGQKPVKGTSEGSVVLPQP